MDVRVIATTNRRLEQSVERKEFREDLYFRLNVVPIQRRRSGSGWRRSYSGREVPAIGAQAWGARARLSPDCLAALCAHQWPGNVRELKTSSNARSSCVARAWWTSSTSVCPKAQPWPHPLPADHGVGPSAPAGFSAPATAPLPVASAASGEILPLDELEKRHLLMVLERCGGNRTQAAKLLGISVRTMRNKLHEYNMSGQDDAEAAEAPASPPASS